jgi:hypothetical protein
MNCRLLSALAAAAFLIGNATSASAGNAADEAGVIVCASDKWDEKEVEKGHKLVDSACRCALVPDNAAADKVAEACSGKYEYMPDGTWKASGTCTDTHPGGDKAFLNWEEGSQLKQYTYKYTGGTGKFQGAAGEGTYKYDGLTDTLFAGRFKGKMVLP